jgi:hypothetical protein
MTIFYEGPSVLDGKPIVAIATDGSVNKKTGDMIQTWILRSRIDPVRAIQSGGDSSICGNCPHRSGEVRTCYVNVGQAPLSVYRAYKRGAYRQGPLPTHKPVRLGAYGDPVAVPWGAWKEASKAPKWAGYTHQWRRKEARPFRDLIMASCDSPAEAIEAAKAGWRTFLVRPVGATDPLERMIQCPSERGVQCAACGLCAGREHRNAPSIWIEAHGTAAASVQ